MKLLFFLIYQVIGYSLYSTFLDFPQVQVSLGDDSFSEMTLNAGRIVYKTVSSNNKTLAFDIRNTDYCDKYMAGKLWIQSCPFSLQNHISILGNYSVIVIKYNNQSESYIDFGGNDLYGIMTSPGDLRVNYTNCQNAPCGSDDLDYGTYYYRMGFVEKSTLYKAFIVVKNASNRLTYFNEISKYIKSTAVDSYFGLKYFPDRFDLVFVYEMKNVKKF
jgi:hypothetical protein